MKSLRSLVAALAAAALLLAGGGIAGAQVTSVPPTIPASGSPVASTTTTVIPQPSTTTTTSAPPEPTTTTTAPQTMRVPVPPETPASPPPAPETTTSTTTTTVAPPSLSPGQVAEVLRDQQRSGASSTSALVEALRRLQDFGMTEEEALTLGMGRFPLLGVANWTDDWLDHRAGPPVHQHQGTDLFAAFDTPVRSPADGTVAFEDAGLGGKGVFVTTADATTYYLAHLNGFARDLASGARVTQGQIVGYNGDSGNARGGAPHVHFEIRPGGGAAINPKPILDDWVAEALARVPELVASFEQSGDGGVPQILVATGMTRRFSSPSMPSGRARPAVGFNQAVLGPLTPRALGSLLDETATARP